MPAVAQVTQLKRIGSTIQFVIVKYAPRDPMKKQSLFYCLLSLSTLLGCAPSPLYASLPALNEQEIQYFKAMILALEPELDEHDLTLQRHDQPNKIKAVSGVYSNGSYTDQYFDFFIGTNVHTLPLAKQQSLLNAALSDIVTPKENDHFRTMIEKIYPYIRVAGIYRNMETDDELKCVPYTRHDQDSKYPVFFIGKNIKNLPTEEQERIIKEFITTADGSIND
jgi:hypothetical protein